MKKGIKVRLYPTNEQLLQLWKSVGTARWVYNWALNKQIENYKNGGKFIKDSILRKELTQLKKTEEFKWLFEVSNNVAKQAVKDMCIAYDRFFKGTSCHPRFKSRKRSKLSFYNDPLKLKVKDNGYFVLLEKVGWVKSSEKLPIDSKYFNPRITFDGKYWYLSISIEEEIRFEKSELSSEILGIDLGIKSLAVCSNGMIFKNINKSVTVRKLEKRLIRLQRRISRKYFMNKVGNSYVKSNNIIKLEKVLKLLHRRLSNIRLNHLHQSTSAIVKTKPCKVVMEDLNIKGLLKNKHLSKSLLNAKLGEFIRQMDYKCERYGIEFLQVDRFYPSSKLCSCCGFKKSDLNLSDRLFQCGNCGNELDRDFNASLNLRNYGLINMNSF